jgi:hypothetical protein
MAIDPERFDALLRWLAVPRSRRAAALRLLGGGMAVASGAKLLSLAGPEESALPTEARPRGRNDRSGGQQKERHAEKDPPAGRDTGFGARPEASRRNQDSSAQGPCKPHDGPHNRCRTDSDCCTNQCEPIPGRHKGLQGVGRCRCSRKGQTCRTASDCCRRGGQDMDCHKGRCRAAGAGKTPTPTPTAQPGAETPVSTSTPTGAPTGTPTGTPTNSATSIPTDTPTATPTSTPTDTPVPPTGTPSSTPTATPVPPTATPTSTPTDTPVS